MLNTKIKTKISDEKDLQSFSLQTDLIVSAFACDCCSIRASIVSKFK